LPEGSSYSDTLDTDATEDQAFHMGDKMGNPNTEVNEYIEVMLLAENQVRITYRQFPNNGKNVIISEEKYHIVESVFGERSEENATTQLIRSLFNLESHKMLERV
jgi:hypothetical protein